jgi:hypothetical protein
MAFTIQIEGYYLQRCPPSNKDVRLRMVKNPMRARCVREMDLNFTEGLCAHAR